MHASGDALKTRKLLGVQHCEHLPVDLAEDYLDDGRQA
jgi:hypothetical protein